MTDKSPSVKLGTPPVGWGATEHAVLRVEQALAAWSQAYGTDAVLLAGADLATSARALLRELAEDRKARADDR
jgi:hypothetical protein